VQLWIIIAQSRSISRRHSACDDYPQERSRCTMANIGLMNVQSTRHRSRRLPDALAYSRSRCRAHSGDIEAATLAANASKAGTAQRIGPSATYYRRTDHRRDGREATVSHSMRALTPIVHQVTGASRVSSKRVPPNKPENRTFSYEGECRSRRKAVRKPEESARVDVKWRQVQRQNGSGIVRN